MNPTGSNEQGESGMMTQIVVVDGVDGLTLDMLRQRPRLNMYDYNFWQNKETGMSLEAKDIADEIVRLEKMQADGLDEYEIMVTETVTRPIAPRLRELHKMLDETGKGPKR